jgi:YVTN family beta-propeller protein
VSPTTATSDANGRAAAAFTLGTFGAPQTVRASGAGAAYAFTAYARRMPEGTSVTFGSRPYALAVSSHDVVYVGRVDASVLTRFDGSSTTPTATVTVGSIPTEIAFNASGTKAYVTNQGSGNVGVVDVATNVQTETIPVTGNPFQVIVSPDATRIYVTTNADYVYAIDLATKTVVGQLATGATANGLAISADGSKLYVSTRAGGSVIEVNTATMTALRTFTTGGLTQGVVLAPDGAEVYVVTESGFLYAYNLATGAVAATVDLGGQAFGMALTPDGTKLFVTVMGTGTVAVVSRATRAITRSYFVDGTPRRIGFTSDGTAVVANEAGYVTWLR